MRYVVGFTLAVLEKNDVVTHISFSCTVEELRLNIKSMVVFFPIKRHLNFCNILQKPYIPHILYFTLVSEMQWLDQPFFGWVSEV